MYMYVTDCGEIQYLAQGPFAPHCCSGFSVPRYSVLRTFLEQVSLIFVRFFYFWWQFFFESENVMELLQSYAEGYSTQLVELLQLIAKGQVEVKRKISAVYSKRAFQFSFIFSFKCD